MSKLLRRLIYSRIAVPTYLFLYSSLLLGLIGFVGVFQPDVSSSPFATKLALDLLPWALIVTVGNILTIIGVLTRNRPAVQIGSMMAFCMWVFASISFCLTGQIPTFLVIILPYLLFFAYMYLAAFFRRFD